MKVLFTGAVFQPTGFGKHSRELIKALKKKHEVQSDDFYVPREELNLKGLEDVNKPIIKDIKDINETITIINDYPNRWDKGHGLRCAYLIHEGTKLFPDYVNASQMVDIILAPSQATKNLAKWNGIKKPIYVVPEGVDPDFYKPKEEKTVKFNFLFVGSWTGDYIDRKGAGLLIKAFHEEFKEDIELNLKISTFFAPEFDAKKCVRDIIGVDDERIKINQKKLNAEEIRELYWNASCFVLPTQGEAFGLTAIEAMACGVPTIITHDKNSGHMDYTKDYVTYVNWKELIQGDKRFYHPENRFPLPDLEDLKKKMREVYENNKDKRELALEGSKFVREKFSWDKAVKKIEEIKCKFDAQIAEMNKK